MRSRERDNGRKGKALYVSTFNGIFFLLFEQGAPHFHFALGAQIVSRAPYTAKGHMNMFSSISLGFCFLRHKHYVCHNLVS